MDVKKEMRNAVAPRLWPAFGRGTDRPSGRLRFRPVQRDRHDGRDGHERRPARRRGPR